ncbi:hypothetical protein [Enterococcus faecalis]|uniref:hypothetical protein n=1 Tax=Enterococcus faecalis TaxID=1351 RepID=UPI0009B44F26|nr:hypothetical protein DRJ72_10280 [Enterococcus faecalis]
MYIPKIKTINLSGLDTSNVTNTSYMFCMCTSLKELDLGNVALRIPETKQIEPTGYHGNVQWFFNNTL